LYPRSAGLLRASVRRSGISVALSSQINHEASPF